MCMYRKIVCVGVIMAGLLIVGGCKSSADPSALPAGSLKGIVSDASTGAPLPGAQVSIAGQVGVFTVTSGPDGAYQAGDLPPGPYLISAQATGYYVNAVQVGVVSNIASDGNLALDPDEVVVVVVTPTPVPTSPASPTPPATATPTPVPTRTPRPSVTPGPMATVSPTPTATPTLRVEPQDKAASPTPVPTRQAPSVSRPVSPHGAPVLMEPLDYSTFTGPRRIMFRWQGSCCRLAADEYYVVSIPHPQGVEEAWVKATFWESPLYLYLLVPESRQLTWSVSVRRHTGAYPNGQWKGPIVSQISETWRFTWHADGGGPQSPLAVPDSPLPAP